ncbi:hypothetical protein MMC11_003021 [Xylographa trunciseda]|nr:hypothetical protein [Xylographa trunciseda]
MKGSSGSASGLEDSVRTCPDLITSSLQPSDSMPSSSHSIRTSQTSSSDALRHHVDHALDRLLIQRILALKLPPAAPPPTHFHVSYRLLVLAECLVIFASLLISLTWSWVKEDVSGGFTIGAYIVGAGTLLVMGLKNYTQPIEKEGQGDEEAQIELM